MATPEGAQNPPTYPPGQLHPVIMAAETGRDGAGVRGRVCLTVGPRVLLSAGPPLPPNLSLLSPSLNAGMELSPPFDFLPNSLANCHYHFPSSPLSPHTPFLLSSYSSSLWLIDPHPCSQQPFPTPGWVLGSADTVMGKKLLAPVLREFGVWGGPYARGAVSVAGRACWR